MNFAQARENMIEGQIKPNKVNDARILEALRSTAKEKFVQSGLQPICYIDEDIEIIKGRFLLEPVTFARMINEANIGSDDIILDVGCLMGYSTAVLSKLGNTVIGLENDTHLVESATKILNDTECYNVAIYKGEFIDGLAAQAPYDVIFINGAVHEVPEIYFDQLNEAGRLVCVQSDPSKMGRAGMGEVVMYQKMGGVISSKRLFDAAVPYLSGLGPKERFTF